MKMFANAGIPGRQSSQEFEGMGIGLATVYRIVRSH
jgi:signal transduction histidine kinase